jgi:hypothetical protein
MPQGAVELRAVIIPRDRAGTKHRRQRLNSGLNSPRGPPITAECW